MAIIYYGKSCKTLPHGIKLKKTIVMYCSILTLEKVDTAITLPQYFYNIGPWCHGRVGLPGGMASWFDLLAGPGFVT